MLRLRTWVNGELRQDGNTAEMTHWVEDMLVELSTCFTLEPGDVLTTGSPAGVGGLMGPPTYLRIGDVVRVGIEGIGAIENTVIEEPPTIGRPASNTSPSPSPSPRNRVELQYDVFERAEDLQSFFDGGAYVENFMGILFDPEDLIARYEAGEALASLAARPSLPPGKTPWDMLLS